MGTSQKTFDQVKSILGKLDRNIDSVRQRRLGDPAPRATPSVTPHNTTPAVIGPTLNTTIGASQIPSAPPPSTVSKSGYGRAQPLRPEARSA